MLQRVAVGHCVPGMMPNSGATVHAREIPYGHSGEGSSRVPDGGPVVAVFSPLAALPSRLPVGGASQPGL